MARTTAFAQQINVLKRGLHQTVAQTMVGAARKAFAEAQAQNRTVLGSDPAFEQFVDGQRGAALERVRPGGSIVYVFAVGAELLTKAVDEAINEFLRRAPVGSPPKDRHPGLFRKSLVLLVNGERRDAARGGVVEFKDDDVVSLTDLQPYARKLEIRGGTGSDGLQRPGLSVRVPNGVFQMIAQTLQRRYGGLLRVRFTFEHYPGFAVGKTRTGGALKTAADVHRATSYPTVTMSLK